MAGASYQGREHGYIGIIRLRLTHGYIVFLLSNGAMDQCNNARALRARGSNVAMYAEAWYTMRILCSKRKQKTNYHSTKIL